MSHEVNVEYCGDGYTSHYEELAENLGKNGITATINGHAGRKDSYEITVNEHLIFSKLSTGRFPNTQALVNEIRSVLAGNAPAENWVKKELYLVCTLL